jgi:hypothetical protein
MSKAYTLNMNDIVSVVRNALLVGAAAGLTYIVENIHNIDWGHVGVFLVPVVTLVIDTVIKWVKGPGTKSKALDVSESEDVENKVIKSKAPTPKRKRRDEK